MMRGAAGGFTLIELLVVLVIGGVLLGLAAPSFVESTARRRIEGVAGELATDLQYAKSQAVNLNTNVSLITSTNSYVVRGTADIKQVNLDNVTLTNGVEARFEPYQTFATSVGSITVSSAQTSSTLRVSVDTLGKVQTCSPGGTFNGYSAC